MTKFISGGALGSDSLWSYYGDKKGITTYHLIGFNCRRPTGGRDPLRNEEQSSGKNVIITKEQTEAAIKDLIDLGIEISGKPASKYFTGKLSMPECLQARNYYQVRKSNMVLAIVPLIRGIPTGGTVTAINVGIKRNIPVYVLNTNDCEWYKYSGGKFTKSEMPNLNGLDMVTTVGTRTLVKYKTFSYGQWVDAPYIGEEKETKIREQIQLVIDTI